MQINIRQIFLNNNYKIQNQIKCDNIFTLILVINMCYTLYLFHKLLYLVKILILKL